MKFESQTLSLKDLDNPLENIWYNRIVLMNMYKDKGKLPEWPLSIEDESGQIFMRDLMGFLEEEIFEAYEHLEHSELILRKGELTTEERLKHLIEFNEEISDTLHIWFEVLIYFNITLQDFEDYYRELCISQNIHPENVVRNTKDIFTLAINHASIILLKQEDISINNLGKGNIDIISYSVEKLIEYNNIDWLAISGGRYLSAKLVRISQYYIFHSLKHLHTARHTLKIKYWRNTDQKPDYTTLHHNLMEGWLYFMCFLCLNNFTSSRQIENIYIRKHNINVDRIKTEW